MSTWVVDARALFHRYRAWRCGVVPDGMRAERLAHLLRYTSVRADGEGMILFAQLDAGREAAQINEQIAWFAALEQDFEWSVYGLDEPADLQQRLQDRGFTAGSPESFMLQPVKAQAHPNERQIRTDPGTEAASDAASAAWDIRRIHDTAGVCDVVHVQEQVWNGSFAWVGDALLRRLRTDPAGLIVLCAYDHERPIGSGWIDIPPAGGAFAELHGGAVLPSWRGKGLYTAMYRLRRAEASRFGCDYLAVDATVLSEAILRRRGFLHICRATPMRYTFTG